jgi:ankyrin repeat protein
MSPLLSIPNEILFEVASHFQSFKDINSLARTSHLFHDLFNRHLYRRAFAADRGVLDGIVGWVLKGYRLSSLTLLLENGLSVDHTGEFDFSAKKETMLSFLCGPRVQECEVVPLARLLIQRGANMEVKDWRSQTVLFRAIYHSYYEIAALLLAHGADPNAVNERGGTPLFLATREGNAEMVNLLLEHDAAVDARDAIGNTPLLVAIECKKGSVIPALLAHGADAGACNQYGKTPLHHASRWFDNDHLEWAKSLLEKGALVNAADKSGETALHWAVQTAATGMVGLFMVRFLLENGADVNAHSNFERSPLQCLRQWFRPSHGEEMAALLLEHGAHE